MSTRNAKPFLKEIELRRPMISNYNQYPFNIPAIKTLFRLKFDKNVTFIVGENGMGKSTLLEAIILNIRLGQEGGGTRMTKFHTNDDISTLHHSLRLIQGGIPLERYFLRAETFYNLATKIERIEEGLNFDDHKKLKAHECSHGESFLKVITQRLSGNGLYIFDEPEAALSPTRQMTLLTAIDDHLKNNSQFIIATHSPILLSYPKATIYQLSHNKIKKVKYEETEHYIVTKKFLNDHENMTEILLDYKNENIERDETLI